MSIFSESELKRYNRHLILPEIGLEGQKKLKDSSVLIVGMGGLGSPVAMYLAAAGVGKLGLVDSDVVDESNLQRQILYGTHSLGKSKLASAQARLQDINASIGVFTYDLFLNNSNALDIIDDYDVIVDCSDTFPTRYLINDACVLTHKPFVYASVYRFNGQLSVFNYNAGPCYRCYYPKPPQPGEVPSCAEGGVLGVLPGVMGVLQATEVIKIITQAGHVCSGSILSYNALDMEFKKENLAKNPDCEACGQNPSVHELIDYYAFCGVENVHADDLEDSDEIAENEIDVRGLKKRRDLGEKFVLLDVREEFEYDICHIDGSILIPLSELETRIDELAKDEDYVVMCKLGGRSARAMDYMVANGFSRVKNLVGGIREWTNQIDDSLAIY